MKKLAPIVLILLTGNAAIAQERQEYFDPSLTIEKIEFRIVESFATLAELTPAGRVRPSDVEHLDRLISWWVAASEGDLPNAEEIRSPRQQRQWPLERLEPSATEEQLLSTGLVSTAALTRT